jgi:YVTN family beta-propeller protein
MIPRSTVTLCATVLLAVGGLGCGTSPSPRRPATARIYVTNQLDNTASVIDGDTHKIVATVRVGVSPAEMAVSPDRRSVYIANTGSNTVSVLNTDDNTVAKTVALPRGSRPIGVALAPDGRHLYTADAGSNRVSVLDTRAQRVVASVRVGTQPLSVAVAPDGKTVYSANSASGDVSVIDARTYRVVRAIPTGRFPSGVAVTADGAFLYITNELSGVTVVNAGNGTVQARLRSPSPSSVAMSPNGDRAYVTGLGPGTLTAIDTGTDRVRSTVSVGSYGTDPFTVRATGDALYVANQGASTLSIIDPSTFRTTATVATGNSPYGIAVVQPLPRTGRAAPDRTSRRAITHACLPIVRPADVRTLGEVLLSNAHNRTEPAMKPRHSISSLVVIAGTALLAAGCGGGSNPSASANSSRSSSHAASGTSSSAVTINNFKFAPASITVKHGARVTVTNQDGTAHTATADDGHSFDTGTLAHGASQTISVSKPGSYPYHCSIHPFMHGTLVVR